MQFYMRLPRNVKEFAVYLAVISLISVNIIAPVLTCMELGFSAASWMATYRSIWFIWALVVVFVVITYKPAEWLTQRLVSDGDSFNTVILANIVFSVLLLSLVLTVLAPMVATGESLSSSLSEFVYRWPRNFGVSFFVEAVIAQPIARAVMNFMHKKLDARREAVEQAK
jgi:hypothetical protein